MNTRAGLSEARRNVLIRSVPATSSLLQRKCDCGGSAGLTACNECSRNSKDTRAPAAAHSRLGGSHGHDFSRLRIYSEDHREDNQAIHVNGPEKTTPKPDAPKTPQKTPPPKEKPSAAKPDCPTDIQVINIDQLRDTDLGKGGFKTGVGAAALMEVSGPGRKDWDGTKIKENVKKIKNTCGAWARDVCSNVSGEKVDFEVGKGAKVLGKIEFPAYMNAFYDAHLFARKDVSVLHQLDLPDCQVQCEQTYNCGGKQIGPTFIITYNATKDTIAKTFDVTRIRVDKSAKAAPATPPPKP